MATLVIDTGVEIVGVFFVEESRYVPYQGDAIKTAIRLIESAEEVVTYNGRNRDFADLGRFAGFAGDLPIQGAHTDMRSVCWSDRIWGSNLRSTYLMHFYEVPAFPDTYEGSNESDCYMTFKLWELWKAGKLKILDGRTP